MEKFGMQFCLTERSRVVWAFNGRLPNTAETMKHPNCRKSGRQQVLLEYCVQKNVRMPKEDMDVYAKMEK